MSVKSSVADDVKDEAINVSLENHLSKRLRFNSLISDLCAQFINLPIDQIDEEIEKTQERVCKALGFHESWLSELTPDKKKFILKYSWRGPGSSDPRFHQIIKEKLLDYILKRLKEEKGFFYSHYDELPEDGECLRQISREMGVTGCVVFPLNVGEKMMGAISWESHGRERHFPRSLVEQLRVISQAFANALSRKRTEEALRSSIAEIRRLKDQLQAENLYLLDKIRLEHRHNKIVGQSRSLRKVLSQVEQVAHTAATVLIVGETGTGKELLARAIHDLSNRKDHPLVNLNCSALPPTLIESEFFGHEQGAYTGAMSKRIGRFEAADGSTIFLDEIGDLPLDLQPKLLRILQEGQFERIGSSKTITVDVRVIAATNRDLGQAVREGRFRKDLYYRLNVFPITIPPLRERKQDIPLLVRACVEDFSRSMGKIIETIPSQTLDALQQYDWPGNIRELRNFVERAMIISTDGILRVQLPTTINTEIFTFETLNESQRKHILKALEKSGGRIFGPSGAAKLLGVNPRTLISRIKRLNIRQERHFG